jgi:hypothetical protein
MRKPLHFLITDQERDALELIRRKGGDRSLAEALRRLIKEASR